MASQSQGLTALGKLIVFLVVVGLLGAGAWFLMGKPPVPVPGAATPAPGGSGTRSGGTGGGAADPEPELAETLAEPGTLAPPQTYEPRDGIVDVELSEYAGYAGLIAANGGLDPSEQSFFARKHGFKVRIRLSEEESWSALNSGKLGVSATTVDVLAVYGRQFHVVVPAQIGFSRGADGIVVKNDIRRVNQLKGKVLIAAQFTEADFFVRYLAQEAGLAVNLLPNLDAPPDPNRLNLVYCVDAFQAGDHFLWDLRSGKDRLAGCVTWAPKTTEVAAGSGGKAHVLVTNKNLLVVADILIANRGFAERNPKIVAGLVEGLLEGNRLVRDETAAHLDVVAKAFGWNREQAREELAKVHLSNLPENLAFFSGEIDAAGSFGSIYQSAILAYGRDMIKNPADGDRFLDLQHLEALRAAGAFPGQSVAIAPIRSGGTSPLENDPLLTRDIRFLFRPNSSDLDVTNAANLENLEAIAKLLRVSPGSTVLLRGHVDNALVADFRKQGGDAFVRQMALKAVDLSKKRAQEIQRLLVERHKVDAARTETVGRGWEEPSSSVSEENRRVEVQWFTVE